MLDKEPSMALALSVLWTETEWMVVGLLERCGDVPWKGRGYNDTGWTGSCWYLGKRKWTGYITFQTSKGMVRGRSSWKKLWGVASCQVLCLSPHYLASHNCSSGPCRTIMILLPLQLTVFPILSQEHLLSSSATMTTSYLFWNLPNLCWPFYIFMTSSRTNTFYYTV